MGIFNRKKEIDRLVSQKVEQALKEKKGYYTDEQLTNERNAFFGQMYRFISLTGVTSPFATLKEEQARQLYYDLLTSTGKGNFVVSAIINQLADAGAQIIDFAELLQKDNKMIEEHPAIDLLNRPNDRFTKKTFIKDVLKNYLSQGEAFVYGITPAIKKGNARFFQLYCIPSHIVDILSQGVVKPISGYRLKTKLYNTTGPQLTPENTLHWFEPNPDPNTVHGLSKLQSLYKEIVILQNAKERQKFISQNGGPAKLITPKQLGDMPLSPKQEETFETIANGDDNSSRSTRFVQTPLEVHDLGQGSAEMQLIETNKEQVLAICNAYNFPIDLLYGNATYHNFKEASAYKIQSVIPIVNSFLESLSYFLGLDKEGLHFELNEDKIATLISDKVDKVIKMKQAGVFTTNELRDIVDYEPVQDDDANKIPVPLTQAYMGDELQEPIDEEE